MFAHKLRTKATWQKRRITPNNIREKLKEESRHLQTLTATLREQMGDEAYYRLAPVFAEMPFIRPMAHYSQLPNSIRSFS